MTGSKFFIKAHIKDVPVDWDDTRILEAEPGDYLTIARKQKGKDSWFVGAISDENRRNTSLALDFLDDGATYQATLYKDAPNANWQQNPQLYEIQKRLVTKQTILNLVLAPGGGCAISLVKQ